MLAQRVLPACGCVLWEVNVMPLTAQRLHPAPAHSSCVTVYKEDVMC